MNQNNRNTCSCADRNRDGACSYGRTPWGAREGCACNRRPWNSRGAACPRTGSVCSSCASNTANTTWKNRSEGCGCAVPFPRAEAREEKSTCSCGESLIQPREIRNTCSCGAARSIERECSCNKGAENNGILDGQSLAMVYSPYQNFDSLYDPRRGLCSGTIFSDLDKPFHGNGRGL